MIIAIDGPAGTGKTTIAKALAKELGFVYIDTGAMYRAITYKALRSGVDLNNKEAVAQLAKKTDIALEEGRLRVDGEDVSNEIRGSIIDQNVSKVASNLDVRRYLVGVQRKVVDGLKGVIVEGRDIASVVFPDARWKFYLDATPDLRTKRRYDELKKRGEKIDLAILKKEIQRRDLEDMARKEGPLRMAKDAIYIDTTSMSIDEVVLKIKERVISLKPFG